MAFARLPFGIKVEVAWETGSGIAVCIHFVSKNIAAAPNAGDLANVITQFDIWRTALRPLQPAVVKIAGIRATSWDSPDGITALTVPGVNVSGASGDPILPLNVAVCASHYSGFTGRSRRGRTYIPGLGESNVAVGDIVLSSSRTAIAAAYTALRANLNAVGMVQVVASFHANGAPRVTALGTAVAVTQVDQYSDSQRRRLAGRGA